MRVSACLAAVAAFFLFGCFASRTEAAILATDDFSYPDGALVPNGGWANQSGTAGTLLVASGEAVVTHDNGSEDTELVFGDDFTTGVVTAEFDIRVAAPGAMTGTDFEYFAHFSDDTSFNFSARLDVVAPTSGGDYTLGIASIASTAEASLPIDFDFGEVVSVSLSFDLDAGLASVTAGGETATSTSVQLGQIIDAFNFRQSSSSSDETIYIDNLVISRVPEPSSILLSLMAASGIGAVAMRRRLG